MVSPASRMLRAISLGVFCRSAPSTSAIMRSRKVSPGLAVMRTTIRSDSTRVPPVTAERSPPDSRMTGADSPVMADSSTEAMPSTTSPSPGISSPAATTHDVADLQQRSTGHLLDRAVGPPDVGDGLGPGLAQRVGLGLAPALGHGLGEVGEQHREPQPQRRPGRRTRSRSAVAGQVADEEERGQHAADLDHEHDRVAGHARGGRACGSCRTAPGEDGRVEQRPLRGERSASRALRLSTWDVRCTSGLLERQVLDDGAERQRREEGEAADDDDDADQQAGEQRRVGREGAGRRRAPAACGPASRRWPAPG